MLVTRDDDDEVDMITVLHISVLVTVVRKNICYVKERGRNSESSSLPLLPLFSLRKLVTSSPQRELNKWEAGYAIA